MERIPNNAKNVLFAERARREHLMKARWEAFWDFLPAEYSKLQEEIRALIGYTYATPRKVDNPLPTTSNGIYGWHACDKSVDIYYSYEKPRCFLSHEFTNGPH